MGIASGLLKTGQGRHDASENLLDLEFNLPSSYRLTRNERIKLKNIMWFISNYKSLYEKCDFENPPFK